MMAALHVLRLFGALVVHVLTYERYAYARCNMHVVNKQVHFWS